MAPLCIPQLFFIPKGGFPVTTMETKYSQPILRPAVLSDTRHTRLTPMLSRFSKRSGPLLSPLAFSLHSLNRYVSRYSLPFVVRIPPTAQTPETGECSSLYHILLAPIPSWMVRQ